MKGKNPTRAQRNYITSRGLDSRQWLVQKDTQDMMQVVDRVSGEVRKLDKKVQEEGGNRT